MRRPSWLLIVALLLALAGWCAPAPALGHEPGRDARLPTIGPAPAFALATQDGERLSLADLRGKVVAVPTVSRARAGPS